MKRFITVAAKHGETVLIIIGGEMARQLGQDTYQWLKEKLLEKKIEHHDQHAHHQDHLPHQGGYVSFHIDSNGRWVNVNH